MLPGAPGGPGTPGDTTYRWVSATTAQLMENAAHKETLTCLLCQQKCSRIRRLRIHVGQHYVAYFCSCGYSSITGDVVSRHIRLAKSKNRLGCHPRFYKVDLENFRDWKRFVGLGADVVFPRLKAPYAPNKYPLSQLRPKSVVTGSASIQQKYRALARPSFKDWDVEHPPT